MVVYDSASIYIECTDDLKERVKRIDEIIDALFSAAADAATHDGIEEYMLDDGQTKIKTIYKGVDQIYASIDVFDRMKQRYLNRLNGRVLRAVDHKNFKRYGYGRRR